MNTFLQDVIQGLSQHPKRLSSKYFYDAAGDRIFQRIMAMEEYYLPGAEREIIARYAAHIGQKAATPKAPLQVIELGAGDGKKTVEFLSQCISKGIKMAYTALDISAHILEENRERMQKHLPGMMINTVAGDYFKTFPTVADRSPKLILFMGSNIGNYTASQVTDFFQWIKKHMAPDDALLMAFDLKKNPRVIMQAYDDPHGITREFNLNLLHRMNRELGTDFNPGRFDHYPYYDPVSGNAMSFIMSLEEQKVSFPDGPVISLARNEPICTEISRKYSLSDIEALAGQHGLSVTHFTDNRQYYTLSLFQ